MTNIRIGQGYDVHRLVEGRKLVLGGVLIPYEKGLLGHSDADVLTHAIMDALLGSLALGDIGKHFPDTLDEYCGISSLKLLEQVGDIIKNLNYSIINIDSTVIIQSPKLAPYIELMRKNISQTLGVDEEMISVKATTEEKLGFTGSGEGIKAIAIAMVEKK